jgi:hypothetical protein
VEKVIHGLNWDSQRWLDYGLKLQMGIVKAHHDDMAYFGLNMKLFEDVNIIFCHENINPIELSFNIVAEDKWDDNWHTIISDNTRIKVISPGECIKWQMYTFLQAYSDGFSLYGWESYLPGRSFRFKIFGRLIKPIEKITNICVMEWKWVSKGTQKLQLEYSTLDIVKQTD